MVLGNKGIIHKAVGKGPVLDMLGKLTRMVRAADSNQKARISLFVGSVEHYRPSTTRIRGGWIITMLVRLSRGDMQHKVCAPQGKARQRHPRPGATCFRIAAMTWAL